MFSIFFLGNNIWVSVYWLCSLSFLFLFEILEDRVHTCRLLCVQQLHNYSFLLCFIFRSWTRGRFFDRRIFLRCWEIDKVRKWILFLATRKIIWFDRRYLFRFKLIWLCLILLHQLFYIRVNRLHPESKVIIGEFLIFDRGKIGINKSSDFFEFLGAWWQVKVIILFLIDLLSITFILKGSLFLVSLLWLLLFALLLLCRFEWWNLTILFI